MRKMVELWEWENEGLGKFGGSQEINFGRTLVVSFLDPNFGLGESSIWKKE